MRSITRVIESRAGGPRDTVHACTDVTGFGLIGHASEVAAASGCTLEIHVDEVPILEGARDLAEDNISGGGRTNVEHFAGGVTRPAQVDAGLLALLYDPQTSGGLLIAVDAAQRATLTAALSAARLPVWRIGRVCERAAAAIVLR